LREISTGFFLSEKTLRDGAIISLPIITQHVACVEYAKRGIAWYKSPSCVSCLNTGYAKIYKKRGGVVCAGIGALKALMERIKK